MNAIVDTEPSDRAAVQSAKDASNAASGDPQQSEAVVDAAAEASVAEEPQVVLPASDEPLPKFDARGASIVTLAVLAALFALQAAALFVIPLVVAVLFAYALDPFVSFLERRHVPRPLGALFVLVVLVSACGTSVYALRFQAQAIVDQIPNVVKKVSHVMDGLDSGSGAGLNNVRRAAEAVQQATDQATADAGVAFRAIGYAVGFHENQTPAPAYRSPKREYADPLATSWIWAIRTIRPKTTCPTPVLSIA